MCTYGAISPYLCARRVLFVGFVHSCVEMPTAWASGHKVTRIHFASLIDVTATQPVITVRGTRWFVAARCHASAAYVVMRCPSV